MKFHLPPYFTYHLINDLVSSYLTGTKNKITNIWYESVTRIALLATSNQILLKIYAHIFQ